MQVNIVAYMSNINEMKFIPLIQWVNDLIYIYSLKFVKSFLFVLVQQSVLRIQAQFRVQRRRFSVKSPTRTSTST